MIDTILADFSTDTALPWAVIAVRLLGAVVLCGMLGLEREAQQRPAGLRTHMMVGLAAAAYCLLTLEIIERIPHFPDTVRMDPLRIIEAVTGGVAFLAAGLVVFSRGTVRFLTTGAGLWLAASVGLACGLGLWFVAVVSALLGLAIMSISGVSDRISRRAGR